MRTIPHQIDKVRETHYDWFRFWMSLHYILGGTAVISTALLATAGKDAFHNIPPTLLPVVAVVSSGLVAFGRVKEQGFAYLKGFRTLNFACIRYCCDLKDDDATAMKDLLRALAAAEEIVEASDGWAPPRADKAPEHTPVTPPAAQEPRQT